MSKKISKSLTKQRIRKLWILKALLDCDQWTQMDIQKLWYIMSVNDLCGLELDAVKGLYKPESSEKKAMKKIDKKYKKYKISEEEYNIPKKQIEEVKEEYSKSIITETLKELNKQKRTLKILRKNVKLTSAL